MELRCSCRLCSHLHQPRLGPKPTHGRGDEFSWSQLLCLGFEQIGDFWATHPLELWKWMKKCRMPVSQCVYSKVTMATWSVYSIIIWYRLPAFQISLSLYETWIITKNFQDTSLWEKYWPNCHETVVRIMDSMAGAAKAIRSQIWNRVIQRDNCDISRIDIMLWLFHKIG